MSGGWRISRIMGGCVSWLGLLPTLQESRRTEDHCLATRVEIPRNSPRGRAAGKTAKRHERRQVGRILNRQFRKLRKSDLPTLSLCSGDTRASLKPWLLGKELWDLRDSPIRTKESSLSGCKEKRQFIKVSVIFLKKIYHSLRIIQ